MSPTSWEHVRANAFIRATLFGGSGLMRAHDALDVLGYCGLVEDWKVSDRIARERIARLARRREKDSS